MTPQIAPLVLLGLDGLMLLGGVWLLVRAFKSWRTERHPKIVATDYTDKAA